MELELPCVLVDRTRSV